MHFQIFIPGGKSKTDLIEVGLEQLAQNVWTKPLDSGPDRSPGLLCSWKTNRDVLSQGYTPDFQDWIPAIADGPQLSAARYWVGISKTDVPRPDELERPLPFSGGTVSLGDGYQWTIPRADALPSDMIRDEDGETQFQRDLKYRRFCHEAAEWQQVFAGYQVGGKATWTALRDFVESALMINYRLTPEICDHLKLWQAGDNGTVLKAALEICRTDALEARDGR